MKKRNARDFACLSHTLTPRNRSGQVWIETVIYTLIAFVMIALVLSYARPKIQELQDRAILQQSTDMLKQISSTLSTMNGAGNQRILEIGVKAGTLNIDAVTDRIIFQLESQSLYSEPDKSINDGDVIVLTQKKSGYNLVTLTRDYSSDYDLKFEGKDEVKVISKSSNSYKLIIINNGANSNGKTIMNMSLS